MYFKYGNFINYEFKNQQHQLKDTTVKNHTREAHTLSLPPLYLSYIPNLELVTNSLPNVYSSIKGKKNVFDPRIQIYQSIQQYKAIS